MPTRRRRLLLSFLASLLVYLIPLVGPHTFFFIGELFLQTQATREPAWRLTNIGAALLLQVVAFAVFYWYSANPNSARGVVVGLAALIVLVESQRVFSVHIPTLFLVENDTAPETGNWPELCSTADGYFTSVPMPEQTAQGTVSEVLLQMMDAAYATMSIPGCALTPVPLPKPTLDKVGHVNFMLGVDYFVPARALLVNRHETATNRDTWSVLRASQTELSPVETPSTPGRILSSDGEWIAWIERIPGSEPPVLERVVMRTIANAGPDVQVDLSPFGPATYSLMSIDMQKREILLSRDRDLIVIGLDGEEKLRLRAQGVVPISNTFKRVGNGWIAWDASRDQESYRVAWSLPAGSGSHRVPKGRSINSVAVTPDAELIALSVATALNIGHIKDAIYVLRARDGSEIFRRYLDTYTRTPVLFPTNDLFLYSAVRGTHVLRAVR